MISTAQIELYAKYQGDIDTFTRVAKDSEKMKLSEEQWFYIERIIEDLIIVENNNASPSFIAGLNERANNIEEAGFEKLKKMIKKD